MTARHPTPSLLTCMSVDPLCLLTPCPPVPQRARGALPVTLDNAQGQYDTHPPCDARRTGPALPRRSFAKSPDAMTGLMQAEGHRVRLAFGAQLLLQHQQ